MTHGSLFSGIGGFDLAAQWMGWKNEFHCEINSFGRKVLHHYWPESESYEDIKTADFTKWRGLISVLSGGFPCQPYSTAGKRLGKEDDRHLWPYMLEAIRAIQPGYVVGENVRGLTNWNGGMVFDQVQADLEAEGYEVLPFLLPACGVNAPHRRDRIWFVAHNANARDEGLQGREDGILEPEIVTNTLCQSRKKIQAEKRKPKQRQKYFSNGQTGRTVRGWDNWPTEHPVCSRDDGLPAGLVGTTLPKYRDAVMQAYGNAVVPKLVLQIFKAIEQYEFLTPSPIKQMGGKIEMYEYRRR